MRSLDPSNSQRGVRSLLSRLYRDTRGVSLAFSSISLVVMLGFAAVAVDLGMLTTARVQSQRAADAAALAGAGRLAMQNTGTADARAEARKFANKHRVLGYPVDVQDDEVEVDQTAGTVRVLVRHRLNTLFAAVVGINSAPVATVATAQVVPAGGAFCPIPVMAVDRWIDSDSDGLYDSGEYYDSCSDGFPCTGFSESDEGTLLEIKSQNTSSGEGSTRTCGAENPEWYCWVDNVADVGDVDTEELEDILFNNCENTPFTISVGNPLEASPGNKMSVVQSIKTFIDQNGGTSLTWNGGRGCVWDGTRCVEASHPRIRPMPVTDPTTIEQSGQNARATVENFVGVFLEKVSVSADQPHGSGPGGQWNLYVRLLDGAVNGVGGGGNPHSLLKSIVLVE